MIRWSNLVSFLYFIGCHMSNHLDDIKNVGKKKRVNKYLKYISLETLY